MSTGVHLPEELPLLQVLNDHFSRYPAMQVQDVYKLLHQASLGSEHAIPDPETARLRLEDELAHMGAGPAEPLFDPLPPDGRLVRLHLRPHLQAGGEAEAVLRAFLLTAQEWHGSTETLRTCVHAAVRLAEQHPFPVSALTMAAFFAKMEAQGFPAVHHSSAYASLYRPAYRVLVRETMESL